MNVSPSSGEPGVIQRENADSGLEFRYGNAKVAKLMKSLKMSKRLRVSAFILLCAVACSGIFLLISVGNTAGITTTTVEAKQNAQGGSSTKIDRGEGMSKVYMTKDISPNGLASMYRAMGCDLPGKVAVKLSTGEPGGHHFLSPALIKGLVQTLRGTIVECNTAYGGQRAETAMHKQVAKDHGFTAIAPVDIMDEEGTISLPFPMGKNIKEDLVGSHFSRYDSFLVLSHFKGHAMGGFGGAIKNISIGIASASGKSWIHSAGTVKSGFRLLLRWTI